MSQISSYNAISSKILMIFPILSAYILKLRYNTSKFLIQTAQEYVEFEVKALSVFYSLFANIS